MVTDRDQMELMVISSLLQDADAYQEILHSLEEDDFRNDDLRALFAAIRSGASMTEQIRASKMHPAEFGNLAIMNQLPSTAFVYAKTLREVNLRERIKHILKTSADVTDAVEEVTKLVERKSLDNQSDVVSLGDSLGSAIRQMLDAIDNKDKLIFSPFNNLNHFIGGIMGGRLITVAGRPGTGKSAFVLQMGLHIAKHKKVLYISLEMLAEELGMRVFSSDTGVSTIKMMNGKITQEDYHSFDGTLKKGKESKFFINNKARTMSEIRRLISKVKPDFLIVDSLNLMQGTGESERIRIQGITRQMKSTALQYQIPIIMVAQLNRESEGEIYPTTKSLKESSSIEEDSDICILLAEVKDEDKFQSLNEAYKQKHGWAMLDPIDGFKKAQAENDKVILCNVAKNRNGGTGLIAYLCKAKRYTFLEIPEDMIYE